MSLDSEAKPRPKRRKSNSDTWKSAEREIADLLFELLGDPAERVPVTGRTMGSAPDIEHPRYALEAKHGKRAVSALLKHAMKQAVAAEKFAKTKQKKEKIPMVVLHEHGTRYTDTYVVVKITDLPRLLASGRQDLCPIDREHPHDLHQPGEGVRADSDPL